MGAIGRKRKKQTLASKESSLRTNTQVTQNHRQWRTGGVGRVRCFGLTTGALVRTTCGFVQHKYKAAGSAARRGREEVQGEQHGAHKRRSISVPGTVRNLFRGQGVGAVEKRGGAK